MTFLMIIVIGVSIIFLDDSSKDLPTIIEEQLICKPFDSTMCDGWKKDV